MTAEEDQIKDVNATTKTQINEKHSQALAG